MELVFRGIIQVRTLIPLPPYPPEGLDTRMGGSQGGLRQAKPREQI